MRILSIIGLIGKIHNGEKRDSQTFFSLSIKKVLQISSQVYKFNDLERKAAPLLYKCIKPLCWKSADLLKKAGDNDAEIQKCLDFIEYEQNREIDFWEKVYRRN